MKCDWESSAWFAAYQDAVLELSRDSTEQRVERARVAFRQRQIVIRSSQCEEQNALSEAVRVLDLIAKQNVRG